ncbi:phosphatidate cytidylyltransferase [Carnobacterium divergens]|uniref:phosphatidate cytidylyltransferase n=1 Tax=Carnobacterium divergens TaxID=2748 RepID=UPI0029C6DF56|nr:phosphatidate cytidylyltransferase [Carnobacterium divergens]MPQ21208.1 phosphatidate cytidylyltransferase [Carnobacterium divergens]
MKQRVITAIVALIFFIPVLYVGSWVLEIVAVLMGLVGMYELLKMKGISIFSIEGIIASIGMMLILVPKQYLSFIPLSLSMLFLFYICGILLLVCTVFSKNSFTIDDAGVAILGALYIGTGFHYFIETRAAGLPLLMFVLFVVWATDIGAYMVGRKIGKTKLAPAISPNKTIEGSLGGMFSAIIVAAIYLFFFPQVFSMGVMLALTVLFSIAGQLGDLVESAFKRHYDVKDSGTILPGHGGILDRFDSLLFVLPIVHLVTLI